MARHGFEYVRGFNSELVTTPFADVPAKLRAEQKRISRKVADWSTRTSAHESTLTGPWIEAIYRRMSERDWLRSSRSCFEASRAPVTKMDRRFLPRAA
jgi:hypothetical protein